MSNPILSIVIANYNYGRFLEDAIKSVVEQDGFDQCELIVVDGGSTDNSVDIIKKYANGLPPNTLRSEWDKELTTNDQRLTTKISWWCSEKDKGQSDAFNKGFAHARGRFGCWLNADDLFMPGSLEKVCGFINAHSHAEWIGASSVFVDGGLSIKWCSRCVNTFKLWQKTIPYYSVNGPSSFFLIDRLKEAGGFDVSLRYTMDTDLWRRFAKAGISLLHVPDYVWCFRVHEDSKTSHRFLTGGSTSEFARERQAVDMKYGISPRMAHFGTILNRTVRLLSGAYLFSYVDTLRYRGDSFLEVKT